jgi:uncharacterized protein YbbC (DUF1343 family)
MAATATKVAAQERSSIVSKDDAGVKTGASILAQSGFAALVGKRLGLVTNHTGQVNGRHLADHMEAAHGVTLAAILTPEHGLRGSVEAGAPVPDERDARRNVPVHSLYGARAKPTAAMLSGLDALVFDIQDIGVRYYTYISTMGLAMQAAAEAGLPFFVLDRPNPLGGQYVAGFTLDAWQRSFVGQYAIPQVHGLTVGELALMIKGERLLSGLEKLDLHIVAMTGWNRGMRWPETGAAWVATSPNIPTFETALLYAGTGLFEATTASDGRGTRTPFAVIGAPWVADGRWIADQAMQMPHPGFRIAAERFVPRAIPGKAQRPRYEGHRLEGVRITVTDHRVCRPVEMSIGLIKAFWSHALRVSDVRLVKDTATFGRLAGTHKLALLLRNRTPVEDIIAAWASDVVRFEDARAKYLLYPA